MTDIIKLLPDSVANQIAAGEVIQRPASAVKEMLENAVDAGATSITLIVKDAGKSLIQVVDNGSGMSFSDARMCFERHATSKIRDASDLFRIRSKGFRGEAMASIAAIAHVELRTKRKEETSGTKVDVEGSKVTTHEHTACQDGTSVSVKNLFFNTPARRNFLKSNASETRHILDEFHRVALAHPDISFSLIQEGNEVYRLEPDNFRKRIAAMMGKNYNERLVPVSEDTTIVSVDGFIGKPEYARKTRGEQFFFVNDRFVRDPYLNHAVVNAFEGLLGPGTFPSYFIRIGIDPGKIDVNIHPTKTEVKFEDERSVYSIIRASVKRALGKFSIAPSLDFEQDQTFTLPVSKYNETPVAPRIKVDTSYNPFRSQQEKPSGTERRTVSTDVPTEKPLFTESMSGTALRVVCQLDSRYILCHGQGEVMIIDQQPAHERIIFEDLQTRLRTTSPASQQQLFPQVMDLNPQDHMIIKEIADDLNRAGFGIDDFGKNSIVISGVPHWIEKGNEKKVLEEFIEQFKMNKPDDREDMTALMLRALSRSMAVRTGQRLDTREMQQIADQLVMCRQPNFSPSGKATFVTLAPDVITSLFDQKSIK